MLTFERVELSASHGDTEGRLIFADGRLYAVLVQLSDLHGDLTGRWFVEISFTTAIPLGERTFETLAEFEAWMAQGAPRGSFPG